MASQIGFKPTSKHVKACTQALKITDLHAMNQIAKKLREYNFQILGPALATIEKINNYYRIHIIIKATSPFSFQDFVKTHPDLS